MKRICGGSFSAVRPWPWWRGAAAFGTYWVKTGRFLESTDDAYVQADFTTIAPKVSGYIADVLVEDNQAVEGRPGAGAHRRPRLQDGAAPGQGRCRGSAKADIGNIACPARSCSSAVIDQAKATHRRPTRPACTFAQRRTTTATTDLIEDRLTARCRTRSRRRRVPAAAARRACSATARRWWPRKQRIEVLDHGQARQGRGRSCTRPQRSQRQAELEPRLHHDHRADRRHRRRPHAARRPVCAGRHAVDGGGAAATRSMWSRTSRRRSSPMCSTGQPVEIEVDVFPAPRVQGPRRQPLAGQRPGIRAAAARQRDRQLHQDRAARPGEDRARSRQCPLQPACAPACRSMPTIDTRPSSAAARDRAKRATTSPRRLPRSLDAIARI